MKKICLLSLMLLGILPLAAQPLDMAYFQAMYKLNYSPDLTNIDKVRVDEMALLIGDNYTTFYSYTNYIADSLTKAKLGGFANMPISSLTPAQLTELTKPTPNIRTTDNIEVYTIERKSGTLICMVAIAAQDYYEYIEKLALPKWEMQPDTQTILDYSCQKATTTYGGRQWTVWFAPAIPIGEGPWELRGLPGLILKAEDADKQYVFECTELGTLKNKKPIEKDTEYKYRQIAKKDYFKERISYYNNPFAKFSEMGVVINDFEKPLRKYNPIERLNK